MWAFLIFVVIAVGSRFIPFADNFSPLMGLTFFAGAHFMSKRTALAAVLVSLLISDLYFGFYESMWSTYLALAAMAMIGHFFLSHWDKRPFDNFIPCWAFGVLFASVAFFLISNFGVWTEGLLYPLSAQGLWTSYVMGLPFFKSTILSTGLFSTVAFGLTRLFRSFKKMPLKQKVKKNT